ncbi:Biogenesis of lysosome-related organelles complex 1 subunit 5 [Trinorchestia longiramus]|nr:Biogenesis of lysosome-related organelles complex 1 subunit 5 [Trinorchestia longiramus]
MAVMSEVAEVFSRLFDHRPFLKGEIAFFKSEFEEKRGDQEVEQLFRALELTTEIKQAQTSEVERQRADRQRRLEAARVEVAAKLASINAAYDLKEKELRDKFSALDIESAKNVPKTT